MVRNEGDVIEAFVRHHAELVDELIVIDHCSTDGTDELLRTLAAEGLPLSVRSERSLVHRQNVILTRLMRKAAAQGADWIVPLDADEFLVARGGNVRRALTRLPRDRAWRMQLRFYVPFPDDPADEANVLERIRHRRVDEATPWMGKVLVPGACARGRRLSLSQGSHGLLETRSGRYAPVSPTDRLALAHFPVRSARQVARKVLGGWPAHVARPDRHPEQAFQWRRAFELAAAGRLTDRRLHTLALTYPTREPDDGRAELIFDPVPTRFELRYRVPRDPTPLEVLAETTERLATELSEALRATAAAGHRGT